jgi:hypothetical protein
MTVHLPINAAPVSEEHTIRGGSNKYSWFAPTQAFYRAVNRDGGCLSIAKKVLNIALLIVVPLNILLLPFIVIYNYFQADQEVSNLFQEKQIVDLNREKIEEPLIAREESEPVEPMIEKEEASGETGASLEVSEIKVEQVIETEEEKKEDPLTINASSEPIGAPVSEDGQQVQAQTKNPRSRARIRSRSSTMGRKIHRGPRLVAPPTPAAQDEGLHYLQDTFSVYVKRRTSMQKGGLGPKGLFFANESEAEAKQKGD